MRIVCFGLSASVVKVEISAREKSCRGSGKSAFSPVYTNISITLWLLKIKQYMIHPVKANLIKIQTYIVSRIEGACSGNRLIFELRVVVFRAKIIAIRERRRFSPYILGPLLRSWYLMIADGKRSRKMVL